MVNSMPEEKHTLDSSNFSGVWSSNNNENDTMFTWNALTADHRQLHGHYQLPHCAAECRHRSRTNNQT